MADRLIRDELLESDRWLDLPTDASRLAFLGFLLICDDFGNFEGGPRRLFRFLHRFTQIKTEQAAAELIGSQIECDLLRRYTVGVRELFHIPRFRPHRQYLVRKVPASPWDAPPGEGKIRKVHESGLAKDQGLAHTLASLSLPFGSALPEGVGVGVGVGVGKNNHTLALAREILAFLNEKAGRQYQPVAANVEFIVSRLKEGATEEEMRQVIAMKCREWSGDEKMAKFLRPATLFNRTKFAQYQGELVGATGGSDAVP